MCRCRGTIPSAIVSSRRRLDASFVCRPIGLRDGSDCDIGVDRVRALAHSRRQNVLTNREPGAAAGAEISATHTRTLNVAQTHFSGTHTYGTSVLLPARRR